MSRFLEIHPPLFDTQPLAYTWPTYETQMDLLPTPALVIKRRKIWAANTPKAPWFHGQVQFPSEIIVLHLAVILSCVVWTRLPLLTKKRVRAEIHKTGALLGQVVDVPHTFETPAAATDTALFWGSMCVLLGMYCIGIVLGYDKCGKIRRPRQSRKRTRHRG